MRVPVDQVYGTYIASYPFGTDTLTLNRGGTFAQTVEITGQQPATVHGRWEFDSEESRANLYGAMIIADGFDHLRKDWQAVTPGIVSLDVEKHWFKILMGSAATHPYVKR